MKTVDFKTRYNSKIHQKFINESKPGKGRHGTSHHAKAIYQI
jgi:hypothetical protein